MRDNRTPDQLFDAATHGNLEDRTSAALALADLNDKRVVVPLTDILKTLLEPPPNGMTDNVTRERIVFELGEFRDPRAVDVLIDTLHAREHYEEEDEDIYDEPDHKVIVTATWALWQIGELRAVRSIVNRLLEDDHWHDNWHYQWSTEWCAEAYEILLIALKSENETTRHRAASMLGELG